jgi:2-deoxy-D-gluconate 3-dehydrogenase
MPADEALIDLLDLSGKTAVVTGGAMGIGRGIAARLAQAGAHVMLGDIDPDEAAAAAAQLSEAGGSVASTAVDVGDEAAVARLFDVALDTFGGLDILVNNAGIFPSAMLLEMECDDFDRVLCVNLRGLYLCTRHAANAMVAAGGGGTIINITSIDALHPSMPGLAHYDASKHGAWGFTKTAALELAPHNIQVNAIAPGGVLTPGVRAMQGGDEAVQAAVDAFAERVPMGRMGEPDDIAKVALFLASDMASYLTGSQIVVDGGALLR